MSQVAQVREATRLTLQADTAAELMSDNPISIRDDATIQEATELLTRRGFSAAPVIDLSGRPVGVVSRSDILVHDRERLSGPYLAPDDADGPEVEDVRRDPARVRDIMTPAVFSVTPATTAASVVEQMLDLNVHHLFVVDAHGVLIGVISTLDVLRRLRR
jgi:CBS-domain-containing membrane protein